MGRFRWTLLMLLACTTTQRAIFAQQPIHWEATIESAKKSAAQSNRLVLVMFTASWCQACHGLENDLKGQPGAPAALEANYVPVKINTEFYPNTAKQYGVTVLPTTVILAPTAQGEVLDVIPKRMPVDQYLAHLNQVVVDSRRRTAGVYAQIPSSPATAAPPTSANPFAVPVSNPAAQPPNPTVAAGPDTTNTLPANNTVATAAVPRIPAGPSVDMAKPNISAKPFVALPTNPQFGLDGFCPVQLADNARWQPGKKAWGIVHRGRTYLFAGPEELRQFRTDPDRYAPISSGNDIVIALEQNRVILGAREHGVQYNGHVFLFAEESSLEKFRSNPRYYADRALQAMQTDPQAAVR